MSDLPPGLRDFGARLEQAAERDIEQRRSRRRRRWPRTFGLPIVAALLTVAVSAGAVRLVDRGGSEPIEPEPGVAGPGVPDPSVVVKSAVDDPHGGPPWVLRVYTNRDGRACVQVGQLRGGRLGREQRGRFRVLPSSAAGICAGASDRGPLIAVRRTGDLTLVFGLAVVRDPVTMRVGELTRRVRPVGLGAFLAVFAGPGAHERIEVRSGDTLRRFG
jgi:hypothetical protein